jgi:hypothetical protein
MFEVLIYDLDRSKPWHDALAARRNSMPEKASKADIVSAALFRDAGSAAVLGCGLTPSEIPAYEILSGKSQIVPGTGHLVDYVRGWAWTARSICRRVGW